jgi:Transposase
MTNDDGRKAPKSCPKAGVGAPSGVDGNGPKRFSVQRKMAIVARLLRGEPLELVARETNVSIARLTEWRARALAGAATALKERERDDRDDEIARLKSKVGEIIMHRDVGSRQGCELVGDIA